MGAGTMVPTIRHMSETIGARFNARVVRINPREPHISSPHISLPCGALEGLTSMDDLLES
jgi:hypothetical protein